MKSQPFNLLKQVNFLRRKWSVSDIFLLVIFGSFLLFFIIVTSRSNEEIEIKVKVTDPNVFYMGLQPSNEFAYSFEKGDIERNEVGQKIAEIIDVERYKTSPSAQTVYLTIKLKANYNPLQKIYSVKGRPIVFGQPLIFTFSNVKVEALVVEFPGFVRQKNKKTVLIHSQLRMDNRNFSDIYGVPTFLRDAVKKGDVVKDKDNQPVIEVLSVRSEPAKRTVISSDNKSLVIADKELFDVYYDFKVEAFESDGKLFLYDYYPLEIGSVLPLVLDNLSVWPTIVDIQPYAYNEKTK